MSIKTPKTSINIDNSQKQGVTKPAPIGGLTSLQTDNAITKSGNLVDKP